MTPVLLAQIARLPQCPRSATDLIYLLGIDAAAQLIAAWPGQEFPVPLNTRPNDNSTRRVDQLLEIVGEAATLRIIRHFGGGKLYIPNVKMALWSISQGDIRAQYDTLTSRHGYSHPEAVFELGITHNISGRGIEKVLKRPDNTEVPAIQGSLF